MSRIEYYRTLEAEISQLRVDLPAIFSGDQDAHLFEEFLGAGEYGLAFEEMTARLIERNYVVSKSLFTRIASLAEQMKIPDEHWRPIKVV